MGLPPGGGVCAVGRGLLPLPGAGSARLSPGLGFLARAHWRVGTMASDGSPGGGCGCGAGPRPLHSARAADVASASSFRAFELLHLHLDLRAELGPPGARGLSGAAVLTLRCLEPGGSSELRLDSHPSLRVTAAELQLEPEWRAPGSPDEPSSQVVPFYTRPFARYGEALCVDLPRPCRAGQHLWLRLTYSVREGPGVSAGGPGEGRGGGREERGGGGHAVPGAPALLPGGLSGPEHPSSLPVSTCARGSSPGDERPTRRV